MSFLDPMLLAGLALVPIGALLARRISQRRRASAVLLAGWAAPSVNRRSRVEVIPGALVLTAFLAFGLAVARPQATVAIPRLEGTLMLTLDVSASMGATDVDPTRLDLAKTVARAIVENRPPDVLIGIVAFSNAGMSTQLPTDDTAALLAAIDRLSPTTGTSLGGGIIAALQAIESSETSGIAGSPAPGSASPEPSNAPVPAGSDGDALIVVLSDGESNAQPDPAEAAQQAADAGVRVVAIGVGTTAGTTLELDGYRVFSALDEETLMAVAETTEGAYIAAAVESASNKPYDLLGTTIVVREERLELTALVAALGLLLLVGGSALSLLRTGKLP